MTAHPAAPAAVLSMSTGPRLPAPGASGRERRRDRAGRRLSASLLHSWTRLLDALELTATRVGLAVPYRPHLRFFADREIWLLLNFVASGATAVMAFTTGLASTFEDDAVAFPARTIFVWTFSLTVLNFLVQVKWNRVATRLEDLGLSGPVDRAALAAVGLPVVKANLHTLAVWRLTHDMSGADIAAWWPVSKDPKAARRFIEAGVEPCTVSAYASAHGTTVRAVMEKFGPGELVWAQGSGWSPAGHRALVETAPTGVTTEAWAAQWMAFMPQELASAYLCAGVGYVEAVRCHVRGEDLDVEALATMAALRR